MTQVPFSFHAAFCQDLRQSAHAEWLLTNGEGAYAMGTVAGLNTRRYHGHLVATRPGTLDRIVLLDTIEAFAVIDGEQYGLSSNQYAGAIYPDGNIRIQSFASGSDVEWKRSVAGRVVSKRTRLLLDNAIVNTYSIDGDPLELILRPLVCHRPYHANFRVSAEYPQGLRFSADELSILGPALNLRLLYPGAEVHPSEGWYYRFERQRELERGLDAYDDLFCPLELRYWLTPGNPVDLWATASPTFSPTKLDEGVEESASKHFIVTVGNRPTIIAGYPWFTDWGRDTMISLPGLLLRTGQFETARAILASYSQYLHQGLIPNRIPEKHVEGEPVDETFYNTADATLWFVNAVHETLQAEPSEEFAAQMLATIEDIVDWHIKGTLFGIQMDPADGLLWQGSPGAQLTWMDAKIGDWVVTPRSGKAVEICALWINALEILRDLSSKRPGLDDLIALARLNFARVFWRPDLGYYADLGNSEDTALRPNQILAMSLPFTPCDPAHARLAMAVVAGELLTPRGLRTLSPAHPDYKGRYSGPMHERDAAYHQGTVWPWLLGPFAKTCGKFAPELLDRLKAEVDVEAMYTEYGIGGIAEVYDGDAPHRPGGCPWQAWSVAAAIELAGILDAL